MGLAVNNSANADVLSWLLAGDVSIQYQTHRDLLGEPRPELQAAVATEGWGLRFLNSRNSRGLWGKSFYQPKWTSTHYTLLDLRNLDMQNLELREVIDSLIDLDGVPDVRQWGESLVVSDVCVNGMFLNYASHFAATEEKLAPIVDFILGQRMTDGGYNCRLNRSGARHSSMHSTISVLEGMNTYLSGGYSYRQAELKESFDDCVEFLLLHRLYFSHRSGRVIHPDFLKFTYPARWKYDILRCMDLFRSAGIGYDSRMDSALEEIERRKGKDGRWKLRAPHPGAVHFTMEKAGEPSRWNTLRAMRVLAFYGR